MGKSGGVGQIKKDKKIPLVGSEGRARQKGGSGVEQGWKPRKKSRKHPGGNVNCFILLILDYIGTHEETTFVGVEGEKGGKIWWPLKEANRQRKKKSSFITEKEEFRTNHQLSFLRGKRGRFGPPGNIMRGVEKGI